MQLVVYYSEFMPPDRCWIAEITYGWRTWRLWRPSYPEAVELGLEDLVAKAARGRREGWYGEV